MASVSNGNWPKSRVNIILESSEVFGQEVGFGRKRTFLSIGGGTRANSFEL